LLFIIGNHLNPLVGKKGALAANLYRLPPDIDDAELSAGARP
jgi:hypothetical protein